ncbi:hypothetical protein LCGC14_3086300, partial [marine sediment metagenome]
MPSMRLRRSRHATRSGRIQFQYSLRTLLLLVGIVGLSVGVLGQKYIAWRQKYIAWRQSPQFRVSRAFEKYDLRMGSNDDMTAVVEAHDCRQMYDADLAFIKDLADVGYRIKHLNINGAPIDGSGLKYLRHAPDLKSLYLGGTQTTSAGLVHIARLKSLRSLHLYDTRVDAQGVGILKALPNLQYLSLADTDLRDEGVRQV